MSANVFEAVCVQICLKILAKVGNKYRTGLVLFAPSHYTNALDRTKKPIMRFGQRLFKAFNQCRR